MEVARESGEPVPQCQRLISELAQPCQLQPEQQVSDSRRGPRGNAPLPQPPLLPAGAHLPLWLHVVALSAIALLLLATAWYLVTHSDKVYRGISVATVELSDLTPAQAKDVLRDWAQRRAASTLILQYAGYQQNVSLGELGFELDVEAAVDAAYGIGRNGTWLERGRDIFEAFTMGKKIPDQPHINRDRLRDVLARIAEDIDQDPVDGRIELHGSDISVIPPVAGRYLQIADTFERVVAALEQPTPTAVDLAVIDNVRPEVDESQLNEAAAATRRLLSGPVTLRFGERTWELTLEQLADSLRFEKRKVDNITSLSVDIDDQRLETMITSLAAEIDRSPTEARWRFTGSSVEVTRESQEGLKLDVPATVALVEQAAQSDASRDVSLPVARVQPGLTGDEIRSWGIREQVGAAVTDYYSGEERMHNIELAASRLDGTLIPRGQTFCLNDALGEVSTATGYQQAYVIIAGQTVPGMGGGLCQVASTLFQAVFWGGYRIVERWPHEYHMPRYESTWHGVTYKGLDATIDAGVRFTFQNNGPSALLLKTSTDGRNLYVSLYGTKPTWQVSITNYSITNVRPAIRHTTRNLTPELPAGKEVLVEKATDGFDSSITRLVSDNGSTIDEYTVRSSYRATGDVYLVGTGSAANTTRSR